MRVVLISDLETQGGAAIAASRLAQGLIENRVEVTRIVGHADLKQHDWKTVQLKPEPTLIKRILRKLNLRDDDFETKKKEVLRRLNKLLQTIHPDVINLHNLHSAENLAWSFDILEICRNFAPTIWTLHDMWSFTGRCAYSYDCRKFIEGCDSSCPTPNEYPALAPEKIAGAWFNKRKILNGSTRLGCISPSSWLASEASSGSWNGIPIEIIPNGLPLNIFKPSPRQEAREKLGIGNNEKVLIVVAHNLNERRKGGSILEEAIKSASINNLTLIMLGEGALEIDSTKIKLIPLNYVHDDSQKVLAYNAADLLVHPAPVDNLPNVIVESIACGTPAVAFPVGGVPEVVRPGITGWLCKDCSPISLKETLEHALKEIDSGNDLRESCRKIAEIEYGLQLQVQRYLNFFATMQPN